MSRKESALSPQTPVEAIAIECGHAPTCRKLRALLESAGYEVYGACGPEPPEIVARLHIAAPLTQRELDVLRAIGTHPTHAKAAAALTMAEATLDRHLANIRHKLNLQSTCEALATAFREGLIG